MPLLAVAAPTAIRVGLACPGPSKGIQKSRALVRKSGVSGCSEDEDALLVKLKEVNCLPRVEIHRWFWKEFRVRSQGTLHVKYSNKLKEEQRAGRRLKVPRPEGMAYSLVKASTRL